MIPARWRWRIGTLLVLGVVVFLVVRGSNRPDDPELAPPSTTTGAGAETAGDEGRRRGAVAPGGVRRGGLPDLAGGGRGQHVVRPPGGPARGAPAGLSDQDDLRGYEAMVFRFDEPSTTRFTMQDTRIPLSIAFFDADGAFVSARDMDPCPPDSATCPTYAADAPFLHALEVEQGALPALGIGPGSRLSFPDGSCPDA